MGRTRKRIDVAEVARLAQEGHTEAEIARRVGISPDTLTRRKQDTAEFAAAIRQGQEAAHSAVSNALYAQCLRGNVAGIVWYEKTRRGFRDVGDVTSGGRALEAPIAVVEIVGPPDGA